MRFFARTADARHARVGGDILKDAQALRLKNVAIGHCTKRLFFFSVGVILLDERKEIWKENINGLPYRFSDKKK